MATIDSVDIGTMITHDPNRHHGRPHIAGTGISVRRIAGWYILGYSPDEIAEKYSHLNLAQVYAALAYYHANQDQMDAEIAAEETEAERLEKEFLASRSAS